VFNLRSLITDKMTPNKSTCHPEAVHTECVGTTPEFVYINLNECKEQRISISKNNCYIKTIACIIGRFPYNFQL